MTTLTYRGYSGVLEIDLESGELFGRTVGLRDVISFQGTTVEEARASFRESVDFYLACCENEGKEPERPYSGRFNVRIAPALHRILAALAESRGLSLIEVVAGALAAAVGEPTDGPGSCEPTWQEVKAALEARRSTETVFTEPPKR